MTEKAMFAPVCPRCEHLENCHIAGHTSLQVAHENAGRRIRHARFMAAGWRRLAWHYHQMEAARDCF